MQSVYLGDNVNMVYLASSCVTDRTFVTELYDHQQLIIARTPKTFIDYHISKKSANMLSITEPSSNHCYFTDRKPFVDGSTM